MGRRDVERGRPEPWGRAFEWAMRLIGADAAAGDLEEEFEVRLSRDGEREARRWFRRQVLRSFLPALRHAIGAGWTRWRADDTTTGGVGMWGKDLMLAARILRKRPYFTGLVALTLALGVGATTALFSVFRTVFLEPLPLPDAEEVVVVMGRGSFGCCGPASGPDYLDWVERNRAFDGLAGLNPGTVTLTGLEEAERVYMVRVTPNVFEMLEVAPALGRTFDSGEADVVVLSHDLWSRLYAGRTDVLGQTLEVEGRARAIIGIMPPDFDVPSPWMGTNQHLLYLPIDPSELQENRGSHWMPVIGRLKDGTDLEGAQADMDRITAELSAEYPVTNESWTAQVFTVHDYLFGDVGEQLALILGAAALVLLIACGNVAGLQLARAAGRETELAVRTAMGAPRRAVVRLLFSESLLLALLGGSVGVVVAQLLTGGMKSVLPPNMRRIDAIEMDGTALVFAFGISAATAIVFGLIPSLFASRTDVASAVREGGTGTFAPAKERLRDAFIVAQIAIGLVLANGAGLLVRSYAEIRTQEYGFDAQGVVTLSVSPSGPQYEGRDARERYIEEVSRAVSEIPGITGVGFVTRLPMSGGSNGNVQIEGWEPRTSYDQGPLVEAASVVGDYFGTMGVPLLRGRLLVAEDTVPGSVGVLINQAMADQVWPDEDPIGKRFTYEDPPPWLTVVGVVGNVRQGGPESEVIAQTYFPFRRGWSGGGFLTVRLDGDAAAIVPEIRRTVLAIDPTQPPGTIVGMDERVERRLAQRKFYTSLITLFALAALFLASAGVYGTVSYFVARRTRELGIRMALGAGGTGIVSLVLRRGVRLAAWGIALGAVGVWATTSVADSLVYGVAALDVITLVLGGIVLTGVAVGASVLPALKAVRVPPVLALKAE